MLVSHTIFGLVGTALTQAARLMSDDLWPAADWDEWPQTRTAALVFDGLVALIALASLVVPCLRRYVCPPCSKCGKRDGCCQRFILPILIGLLCGVWLHFIPCIWWTCDWGEHDGQAIRGAIWFVTWGIVTSSLCCMRSSRCKPTHNKHINEAQTA